MPRDSSIGAVRRVFKAMASVWHPDKTSDTAAHERFIMMKQAHDRLIVRLSKPFA